MNNTRHLNTKVFLWPYLRTILKQFLRRGTSRTVVQAEYELNFSFFFEPSEREVIAVVKKKSGDHIFNFDSKKHSMNFKR